MHEKKPPKKIIRLEGFQTALFIFLLAAVVRALYLYDSSDNPTFFAPVVDSLTYDQMAREFIKTASLTHEFFWQPLFYPLFLSLTYKFTNSSILTVKIVQAFLGCLTCVLAYLLGSKLFGKTVGILAGAITALYMPLVFFEGELLAVGWAAFWSMALLLTLIKAGEKPNICTCFVLGLSGAFSIVTRPLFLPFFTAACIWLMVVWIRRHIGAKKFVLCVLTAIIGFSVVASPAAYLSHRVIGRTGILPYSGGINLYIGNNPNYRQTITTRPGLAWRKLTELPDDYGITDRFEKERFFSDKALNYILNQPVSFLKGLVYKTAQFLSSREMPRNVDIYLFRKWSPLLQAGVWKTGSFGFPFGLLLPITVAGLVFTWRKVPVPIWLFLLLYPASVISVFVTSRYRMPIIPLISILAAAGCTAVWNILQSRKLSKILFAGVIILITAIAASAAGPFYAEQIDYEPELYYGLADSLDKHGRPNDAINAYSRAISLRGDYVEAHHNLALLLVDHGRIEEAIAHYQVALELDPKNAGLNEDYGVALFKQGKIEQAIEQYHKAIELQPDKATVYDNLGTALFKLNRLQESLQSYSRAIELNPNDAVPHNNIGNVLALQGQLIEALEHYQISLSLKLDDPETLNNIANALASLKRFQEATVKYNEALQISPNDAGIYCNLGICLKQQGKIAEAEQAYKKALSIDPGHKRAQQALQQLKRN